MCTSSLGYYNDCHFSHSTPISTNPPSTRRNMLAPDIISSHAQVKSAPKNSNPMSSENRPVVSSCNTALTIATMSGTLGVSHTATLPSASLKNLYCQLCCWAKLRLAVLIHPSAYQVLVYTATVGHPLYNHMPYTRNYGRCNAAAGSLKPK